jgi:glycosyltransferase involved in cell wall biosynthesis
MNTRVGLHIGQLTQPAPGGIGTYVRALLKWLPQSDIALTPFIAGDPPADVPNATRLRGPQGALRYELWHRFRRPALPIEVDVVHAPSLAVAPARTRRNRRTALVVTVHDVAFMRFPETFTERGVAFHTRGLEIARREADVVITPSEFTRDELLTCDFDPDKVVAIPHGISASPLAEVEAQRIVATQFGIATPFVFAVGTIEPRKGFDFAADVISELRRTLPQLTLVVAGSTGWGTVANLDREGVHLLGRVEARELAALYQTASATLVPSLYEGFGLPALEAMAHGCPVIATNASSLPEVVGDAGILLDRDDRDAWMSAVHTLVTDTAAATMLRAASLDRAATFSWANASAAHANAYRSARASTHGL